jgi:hypothetical protein
MNKAGIRNQVLALLNRNDATNTIVDTFIDQAVARIQRTLRIPPMEKVLITTTTGDLPNTVTLPTDYLGMKHLYSYDRVIEFNDVGTFISKPSTAGKPSVYTRIQGGLQVKPIPPSGTEITMIYYGEIPDLNVDTDENFLTVIAPDLLIYGALTYAADFYVDDRKQLFEDRFAAIYNEVEEQARMTEMDQSSMRIQPAYEDPTY